MPLNASRDAIVTANKAAFDNIHSFFQTSLDSLEKFSTLNFSTARTALAEQSDISANLLDAKDLPTILEHQGALAKPQIEKIVSYSRDLYAISNEAREALFKLLESQYAELNDSVSSALDRFSHSTSNSDAAVAAAKSAILAANSAVESLSKVARHVVDVADASVSATTSAVSATGPSTTRSKKAA
jgi:phasin family protein